MTSAAHISVPTLLVRLSDELAELHRLSLDHQTALSALTPNAPPPQPWISAGLQGIDRLAQVLIDLSRLLSALAGEVSPDRGLPAVRVRHVIILQDLASRLLEERGQVPAPVLPEPGEVSWF